MSGCSIYTTCTVTLPSKLYNKYLSFQRQIWFYSNLKWKTTFHPPREHRYSSKMAGSLVLLVLVLFFCGYPSKISWHCLANHDITRKNKSILTSGNVFMQFWLYLLWMRSYFAMGILVWWLWKLTLEIYSSHPYYIFWSVTIFLNIKTIVNSVIMESCFAELAIILWKLIFVQIFVHIMLKPFFKHNFLKICQIMQKDVLNTNLFCWTEQYCECQ